jgi:hypothetical protein
MIRFLSIVAALVLAANWAGQARAGAILYFVDQNMGTDEMAAALAALSATDTTTVASSPLDFAAKIASGSYDLGIFSQQVFADFANPYTNGTDFSTALSALATFVSSGGKAIVDTWNPNILPSSYVSAFGANYTGATNEPAVSMTSFNSGVTNPVSLSNPGYVTFSTGMTLAAITGTSIAGTFPFDGEAAVIVGNGGKSIVNGFLNDTAGTPGEQIYENEINTLLPPVHGAPEPSSWSLIALGISLIGYARLRPR